MSVQASPQGTGQPAYAPRDDDRGYGWVAFAGVLLALLAVLNFIDGLAAVTHAHFFSNTTNYITGNLKAWGWTVLCLGVAQGIVALGIFAKNQLARWVGVVILALDAIAQLMMIPGYPFWSLSLFTLDILAIYGLVAYGQRIAD